MGTLLNTANPIAVIVITLILAAIVYVSVKTEQHYLLIGTIVVVVGLLIYHSIYLDNLESVQTTMISQTYHCLAIEFIWMLISFISFLWVDDKIAKKKNLKSYDDSLSWFWNKL